MLVGCRLDLRCGTSLLVYPTDRTAYSRLCRLLSLGKGRAGKGACDLGWDDVAAYGEGMLAILLPDQPDEALSGSLDRLRGDFGDRAYLALTLRRRPNDAVRLYRLTEQARTARVATVATGDVLYHDPRRRILQDVLTCIREGRTIDDVGFLRERFADRHLRPPGEMARLFARHPDAVARTLEIAQRCLFSLSELRYQYPTEMDDPSLSPQKALEDLTWKGARERYAGNISEGVRKQLQYELELIAELEYAPYFLTVYNIVRFARSKGILCQGRGSAANSAVCFVLAITSIDPVHSGLLFERFVSAERREPPDIDVDFEHERREEVIQWVYDHYGRDRAALCSTVICYRTRGAVRDVGKALGLSEDVTGALASQIWGWSEDGVADEYAAELNLNLQDRRLSLTMQLTRELIGFPRHLSQHPGGFVLTHDRLDDLVPIEPAAMADRQVIEWDKDDVEHLKFMKVDVLGLGMLGCMRRAFDLLQQHYGKRYDLASVPGEDAATYAMIQKADTIGTFQIESRAQMSMLPRLKPRTFYDLVIEIAIVRPGPIQGDMVHPYLRRRDRLEPVDYPTPELKEVLEKTLGVPLFQEQAMRVAIICAGFTANEADALRRSMATFKMSGGVSTFQKKMIEGMKDKGYTEDFAERTFRQIEGFGSYGFPESHAASFALIAYASCWVKCHHPDVFCVALLNAQPMGFYAPAQIVRDAKLHGVEIRPVCINRSAWDCTLEPSHGKYFAVRLGLRMTKGLAVEHGEQIANCRNDNPYGSIEDLWRRAGVPVAALEKLADADAYHGLGMSRRNALWTIRGLDETELPLVMTPSPSREPKVRLRRMTTGGEVVADYRSTGLTLRQHPVGFLRSELDKLGAVSCSALPDLRPGRRITIAGVVLVRQRPGSAKGVMFSTIEDETGHANIIVWPKVFERQRRIVMAATMISVRGILQRESGVIHVVAEELTDLSELLASVGHRNQPIPINHGRGDHVTHGGGPDPRERGLGRKPHDIYTRDIHIDTLKVKSRNFH
jgi:error-prone DNA polymerase